MKISKERTEHWRRVLAQYVFSDVGPVEFARRNHLSRKSFYRWRRRFLSGPVRPDAGGLDGLELCEVRLPGDESLASPVLMQLSCGDASVERFGRSLRLVLEIDTDSLRRLLDAREGMPC